MRHYFYTDFPISLALFSIIFKNLLVLSVVVELCVLTMFCSVSLNSCSTIPLIQDVWVSLYIKYRRRGYQMCGLGFTISSYARGRYYLFNNDYVQYFRFSSTFKTHAQNAIDLGSRVDNWIWESSLNEVL